MERQKGHSRDGKSVTLPEHEGLAVSVTLAWLILLMRRLLLKTWARLPERRSLTAMNAKRGGGRPGQACPRQPDVLGSAAAFTSHSPHSEFYG